MGFTISKISRQLDDGVLQYEIFKNMDLRSYNLIKGVGLSTMPGEAARFVEDKFCEVDSRQIM